MKNLLISLLLLFITTNAWAVKVEDLSADTTPGADSLLYSVDDPAGTPTALSVTIGNAAKGMTSTDLIDTADILYETELDTFAELDTQIADQTLIHSGSNVATATALASNGANCSAGSAPLGVDASGAAESCTDYEEDLANEAGLETAVGGANVIVETEVDTIAELNAILTDATLVTGSHTTDTSAATACTGTDVLEGSGACVANAGGGTPGGSDTQFQYNNSSAFGGATELVRPASGIIQVDGSLGIGTSAPTGELTIVGDETSGTSEEVLIQASSNGNAIQNMITASDTGYVAGKFQAQRSRGTVGSETDTQMGDTVARFAGDGYLTGAYADVANINFNQDANGTSGTPGSMSFWTSSDGGSVLASRMIIDMLGDVDIDGTTFHVDATDNYVGIGTSTPTAPLDVTGLIATTVGLDAIGAVDMDYGSADVTDHTFVSDGGTVVIDGNITTEMYVYHQGDLDTNIRFDADTIRLNAGALEFAQIVEGANDYVVWNENSADIDFRWETDNNDSTFGINGGNDAVTMEALFDIGTPETFTGADATPDVSNGIYWNTDTAGVTITDFDGTPLLDGQTLYVVSKGATVYDCTSSGLNCGSTDITTASGDTTLWIYTGTDWDLVAYKDQSADAAGGGGGGSVAGSDSYVQFNDGGAFGADSDFTWDDGGNGMTITGSIAITGGNSSYPHLDVKDTGGTSLFSVAETYVRVGDGAGTLSGQMEIGGIADEPQLVIEAFSTQTDSIVIVQDDLDAQVFSIEADGAITGWSTVDVKDQINVGEALDQNQILLCVNRASTDKCATWNEATGVFDFDAGISTPDADFLSASGYKFEIAGTLVTTRSIAMLMHDYATAVSTGTVGFYGVDSIVEAAGTSETPTITDMRCYVVDQGVTGSTDVTLWRRRSGTNVEVFSTDVTIGAEYYAEDGVVNTSNDDLALGDMLLPQVTGIHTTPPNGLNCNIEISYP